MEYEILPDTSTGICRVRLVGPLVVSEYQAAIEELLAKLGPNRNMPTLYDLRSATLDEVTASDMRALGEVNQRLAERRGEACVALLVDSDLNFGLARMYEVIGISPNLSMRVFREEVEAEEWLLRGGDQQDTS